AGHHGAVDGGGAAPARQQRGMQIEATEFRRVENGLRQDHAVGNDHGGVRVMRAKLLKRFGSPEGCGRQHGNAKASRLLLDWRWLQLQATTSAGLRRAGVDGSDLVAVSDEF